VASLSERDAAALLAVVTELERLDDPLPFPPRFMRLLGQLIGTSEADYCVLDRRNEQIVHESFCSDGAEFVEGPGDDSEHPYWRLRHSHPVCSYRERSGDWTTVRTVSEFASQREFRRTAVWDECYRYEGVNYWLDIGLPARGSVTRMFIFVHGTRDFGDRERLLLSLLQPHLERRAAEVEAREAAVEALVAVDGSADDVHDIVLATTRGTIEFASPRARLLLGRYLRVSNGALPPEILRGTTVVPADGGRLTIRATRLDTLVVLLLGEADVRADRLTSRQREVLAGVAAGLTDGQIADRLGVAPATVGKHLESIYERLGVHTRTAAAAVYRGLPGTARGWRTGLEPATTGTTTRSSTN
jgi:DNA-binding CsgD family transcriptional regulator